MPIVGAAAAAADEIADLNTFISFSLSLCIVSFPYILFVYLSPF